MTRMNGWETRSPFLGLGFMLVLLIGVLPVNASSATRLEIDPEQVEVPLGNQVLLNLAVMDGVNVNAFDITVIYDQPLLSLAGWSHGDYLDNLYCVHQLNQPGRLELACTQIARPGVSGDGVLLELVFDTLHDGTAVVTLEKVVLADPQGGSLEPELGHGTVAVGAQPTHTSTPSVTFTPTQTFTATVTRTSTPVPTATETPVPTPTLWATATAAVTDTVQTTATTVPPDTHTPDGLPNETRTITPTAPEGEETPGVYPDEGHVLPSDPEPPDPIDASVDQTNQASAQPGANRALEILLWSTLVISLLALALMFIILIRQRTRKKEDYLL